MASLTVSPSPALSDLPWWHMARPISRLRVAIASSRRRKGVSSIIGTVFFILIVFVVFSVMILIFDSYYSFTNAQTSIAQKNAMRQQTSVSPSFQFGSEPTPSGSSNPPAYLLSSMATSAAATSTDYTFERKLVYAQSLWWAFYSSGSGIVFSTSSDGETWSGPTTLTSAAGSTVGYGFSVYLSGASTLFYVLAPYNSGTSFTVGKVTLNAAGTITPVTTLGVTDSSRYPVDAYNSITSDSSGNVWISVATTHKSAPSKSDVEVFKCTSTLSSCTFNNSFTVSSSDDIMSILLGLSSGGELVLLYADSGAQQGTFTFGSNPFKVTTYSGTTWSGTTVTTTTSYNAALSSAIAVGTTVYFAGSDSSDVRSWSCTYPCSSTPAETVIDNSGGGSQISISQDGGGNALSVTYGTGSNVYFLTGTTSGGSVTWNSASSKQTISSSENSIAGLTATYSGALVGAIWTSVSSNAYVVRFATANSGGAYNANQLTPSTVATSATQTATSSTYQDKLLYAQGLWWDFFSNGLSGGSQAIVYSTSSDGIVWSATTTVTGTLGATSAGVGGDFDLSQMGNVVYWVLSNAGAVSFIWGYGTLSSAGTVIWSTATVNTGGATLDGPVSIEIDSSGNAWVALETNTGTTYHIEIYEHATGASVGTWSSNLAPSSLATLSNGAVPVIESPGSPGALLVYEAGVSSGTGVIDVIETTVTSSFTSSTWSSAVSPISDYSLGSSSAVVIGNALYFAGLASSSTGQTSGTLQFWSYQIGGSATSSETTIENTSASWQAALSSSGSTLCLFDAAGSSISYYLSYDLGSTWTAEAVINAYEPSVTGLSAAESGTFAVTWVSNIQNVRFASLSSFSAVDNSAFPVHLISLYVYEPSANSLITHYDSNPSGTGVSGLFDYWVGPGTTLAVALSPELAWTTSTSYVITATTDTGVLISQTYISPA
jgi:hypothetical protein